MKRQTTLSLVPIVSVLLSLACFVHSANGQIKRRPMADTGFVTLGDDQVLRITVNGLGGNDTITVGFRRIGYTQGTCNAGVCTHTVAGQSLSGPITLSAGEAASIDIPRSFLGGVFVGVRGVVLSSSREVRVSAFIIDATTGKVITSLTVPALDLNLLGL